MERDWVAELEGWLQDRFVELCETIGQPVPFSGLRISPALGFEESKYFLLGVEAGLFQPDEFGYVQSELLPPPSTGNIKQRVCRIFWYDSSPPRLVRECICQLSTASSLIVKRGWLTSHIQMEPDLKDDRDLSYGMDILVRSRTDQILACVEVKRSVAELQKLVTDLSACCKRGAHAKDGVGHGDCRWPPGESVHQLAQYLSHHLDNLRTGPLRWDRLFTSRDQLFLHRAV